MKILLVSAVAAMGLTLGFTGESLAQSAPSSHRVMYDAQTVWRVSGEVISVGSSTSGSRGYAGVHVLLKTASGELSVRLGPGWFMGRQAMQVAPHDVIEVTGSPVIYDGKPTLIAAEVRKGAERLQLRTAGGIPLWSRGGAR